jgi:U1 zinc finger
VTRPRSSSSFHAAFWGFFLQRTCTTILLLLCLQTKLLCVQFWVSQKNHWCEYCKCWLKDTPAARAVHERGIGHQENVAKSALTSLKSRHTYQLHTQAPHAFPGSLLPVVIVRSELFSKDRGVLIAYLATELRQMRKDADEGKRQAALVKASIGSIESAAQKQYEADLKAAEQHKQEVVGEWVLEESSGYLYNALHRYYFEPKTGMYYGGDPPAWTITPDLPDEARCQRSAATEPASGVCLSVHPSIHPWWGWGPHRDLAMLCQVSVCLSVRPSSHPSMVKVGVLWSLDRLGGGAPPGPCRAAFLWASGWLMEPVCLRLWFQGVVRNRFHK